MPFDLDDVMTIEEGSETLEDEIRALQHAINSGHAWSMQGSYGRAMMDALEAGYCILGVNDYTSPYGLGHTPSRTQVKQGTKGSTQYARHAQPEFWAYRSEDWADN